MTINHVKKKYTILLLGSGGREHALAWKMSLSPLVKDLYIAPGNAGMQQCGKLINLNHDNQQDIVTFCHQHHVDLCVIGSEATLAEGLTDTLTKTGIAVFGPEKKAAQLEASKVFTKKLCLEEHIPTAHFDIFSSKKSALTHIEQTSFPCVIKADGLAAGKGVVIAQTLKEAQNAIHDCFDGKFSHAGKTIIIEEFLQGVEVSFFVMSDGKTHIPFGSAQDYKRAYDEDKGPNTGGMGAISPSPYWNLSLEKECLNSIIIPTIETLRKKNIPYKGILYAGLMITKQGPKLIEYNVRFGDPECQLLMLRYAGDIVEILYACATETLHTITPQWHMDYAANIVIASKGYPEKTQKGSIIHLPELSKNSNNHDIIFHAGTALHQGNLIAIGGRVLNCCSRAKTLKIALEKSYKLAHNVQWKDGFFRHDIGK